MAFAGCEWSGKRGRLSGVVFEIDWLIHCVWHHSLTVNYQ